MPRIDIIQRFLDSYICLWELSEHHPHKLIPVWHEYTSKLNNFLLFEKGERKVVLLENESIHNFANDSNCFNH